MQDKITIENLWRAWDKRCMSEFGVGADDLPDIIMIDDYYFPEMGIKDVREAVDEMAMFMHEEMGN